MSSEAPTRAPSRADYLISVLHLSYLPKESGYIGLLGRSSQLVQPVSSPPSFPAPIQPLAAQSHNYYLLTPIHRTNYLHHLGPDDTHILIEGGPVHYYVFTPPTPSTSASATVTTLGTAYHLGQTPIISVRGGCYKALKLADGAEYALMANVLSPEFTEDRVRIGAGREWVDMFQGKAEWASEEFLRELIGVENWIEEQQE